MPNDFAAIWIHDNYLDLITQRLRLTAGRMVNVTLKKIESNISKGGIPINTGWLVDGMWGAITLDNVAEVHLMRGTGDAACAHTNGVHVNALTIRRAFREAA